MSEYFGDVWSFLKSPEWLASTGIPLLVTVLGLTFAYWALRRQLGSDRQLRRADYKRAAATSVGSTVRDAVIQIRRQNVYDVFWTSSTWPDHGSLKDAVQASNIELPRDLLSPLEDMLSAVDGVWVACHMGAKRVNPDSLIHANVVKNYLEPYVGVIAEMCDELVRWDGDEPLNLTAQDMDPNLASDTGQPVDAVGRSWLSKHGSAYLAEVSSWTARTDELGVLECSGFSVAEWARMVGNELDWLGVPEEIGTGIFG